MTRLLLAIGLVLLATATSAQTVIGPNSKLAWDIAAVDVVTAQSFTYAVTIDGGTPVVLTPVTCVAGTAPNQTCSTPIAQIPIGSHTITLTAASGALVSLPSAPFAYVDLLIPVPQNTRVTP